MTKSELEAIRQRAEAATPGPWESWCGRGWPKNAEEYLGMPAHVICWPIRIKPETQEDEPLIICRETYDQDFIAHARTDIPNLLAEVDRLNAELKRDGIPVFAVDSLELTEEIDRLRAGLREAIEGLQDSVKYDPRAVRGDIAKLRALLEESR